MAYDGVISWIANAFNRCYFFSDMDRVCLFFNDLAIYRRAIYKMIDQEYDCDWFIEDIDTGIREFDANELKRVKRLPVCSMGPFYLVKGLTKLLKKEYSIYFVLGSTRNLSLFAFCLIKKLFYPRKRVYFWTHGFYGKESWAELFFWKRPFFKLPNGLFPYSDYCKTLMVNKGFNPDKIFPIHNSLDYDSQLLLRKSVMPSGFYFEHFGNSDPVLIIIGRLNLRKRLDLLFEAVDILRNRGESYNIVLVGDGEDKNKLQQMASEMQLIERTWFYGPCYDERQNATLLVNSDMCVVPGDIGLTAIHALMFGVPAITHNCFKYQGPEFEAIKPGFTGDFYEYGSVESLANVISNWFNTHNNREKVRTDCYGEIDSNWNPYYQLNVIREHLK